MFSKGLRFIKNERQNIFNLFLINQTTIKQLVNKYGELCYFMFNRRQLPSGRPDSSQLEFVLLHLLLLLILLPTSNSMRFFCNRENQYIFQDALGYVIEMYNAFFLAIHPDILWIRLLLATTIGLKWTNLAKFLYLAFIYQYSFTIYGVPELWYFSYWYAPQNNFTRKEWIEITILNNYSKKVEILRQRIFDHPKTTHDSCQRPSER